MYTAVVFSKSDNAFKPDIFSISFGDNGAMVINTYALTLAEVKDLHKQLTEKLSIVDKVDK